MIICLQHHHLPPAFISVIIWGKTNDNSCVSGINVEVTLYWYHSKVVITSFADFVQGFIDFVSIKWNEKKSQFLSMFYLSVSPKPKEIQLTIILDKWVEKLEPDNVDNLWKLMID